MNFEQARFNMIEQQVRPWDVLDQRVLDVIASTPRDEFAPEQYRNLAYSDCEIPLPHGQSMLKPVLEGRMLQAVTLKRSDEVLQVGTGSGYLTACLAKLAGHVYSIDIEAELTEAAAEKLRSHGVDNVTLESGDAAHGWHSKPSYDVIVLTGSVDELPQSYKSALALGGRLFVVVGNNREPIMEATLITRLSETEWRTEVLFETQLPPLKHAQKAPAFVF